MDLNTDEYTVFRQYLKRSCGIDLGDNKQYLVASRLRKILSSHEVDNLKDLVTLLERRSNNEIKQEVIDAMTTNETSWFRDTYPFDYVKSKWLPEMQEKSSRSLRIWSAACSSGQEPYSLSMLIEENNRSSSVASHIQAKILATDLSQSILSIAKDGVYDKFSIIRGLPADIQSRYFKEQSDGRWSIDTCIKNRIDFQALNLQDSYRHMGIFDIIFCRNVLIYFSVDFKQEILRKMRAQMNAGSLLFLGASESISGVEKEFELIDCAPGLAYRAR